MPFEIVSLIRAVFVKDFGAKVELECEGCEDKAEEDAAAEDVPLVEVVDISAGGCLPIVAGKYGSKACCGAWTMSNGHG